MYYGHRYYNASLGRFVNRDPIEESGGLNLYAFCANDGINRWDVLGYSGLLSGGVMNTSVGGAGGGVIDTIGKGAEFYNATINAGNETTGLSLAQTGGGINAQSLNSDQNAIANNQAATADAEAQTQAQAQGFVDALNGATEAYSDSVGSSVTGSDSDSSSSESTISTPGGSLAAADSVGLSTAPGTQAPTGTVAVGPLVVISDNITGSTADYSGLNGVAADAGTGAATASALDAAAAPAEGPSETQIALANTIDNIDADINDLNHPSLASQMAATNNFAVLGSPVAQYGPLAFASIGLLPLVAGGGAIGATASAISTAYYGTGAVLTTSAGAQAAYGFTVIVAAANTIPDAADEQMETAVGTVLGEGAVTTYKMIGVYNNTYEAVGTVQETRNPHD